MLFHGETVNIPVRQQSAAAQGEVPRQKRRRAPGADAGEVFFENPDDALLERLRSLRFRLAKEAQVPAYVIFSNATLSAMARTLEAEGKRVVGGTNGDFYVLTTGQPLGMVVTDGVVRSSSSYHSAIGFRSDGTAFVGTPNLYVSAVMLGERVTVFGGVNKVRQVRSADGGGLTLLTPDFGKTTQNTSPGVDVFLRVLTVEEAIDARQPQTTPQPEPEPVQAASAPEAEAEPAPEEEPHFKEPLIPDNPGYINVMQVLVEEKAPKYIQMFGLCPCERCLADVKAFTLNHLPSKYVVIERGDLIPRLTVYEGKFTSDVTAQLLQACKVINERPHHGR